MHTVADRATCKISFRIVFDNSMTTHKNRNEILRTLAESIFIGV
jgi:hypothetical protein